MLHTHVVLQDANCWVSSSNISRTACSIYLVVHVLLLNVLVVLTEGWYSIRIDWLLVVFAVRFNVLVVDSSFMLCHQYAVLLSLIIYLHLSSNVLLVTNPISLALHLFLSITLLLHVNSVPDLFCIVVVCKFLHLVPLLVLLDLALKCGICLSFDPSSSVLLKVLVSRLLLFSHCNRLNLSFFILLCQIVDIKGLVVFERVGFLLSLFLEMLDVPEVFLSLVVFFLKALLLKLGVDSVFIFLSVRLNYPVALLLI